MGAAFIFVPALAAFGIITPIFLCHLSHAFLLVLTETSAGTDEVRWPLEGVTDWWWKPLLCVGIFVFWFITGLPLVAPFFLAHERLFYIVYPIFLWLVYPLSLLSTLAAGNVFMLIYPPLLGWLAAAPRGLVIAWCITLPLPLATAGIMLQMLRDPGWVVVAALLLPAAVMFYARVWGRLAWLILNPRRQRREQRPHLAAVVTANPWQVPEPEIPEVEVEVLDDEPLLTPEPEEVEDEWSPHKKPYLVVDEEKAKREWQNRRRVEVPIEPGYDMTPDEPPPPPIESEKYRELNRKDQRRQNDPNIDRRKPTLARAFGAKLFGFLMYAQTLRPWLTLSALSLVELLLVYLLLSLLPAVH
jgi:hypothetical protein